jgi:hypothetical protein
MTSLIRRLCMLIAVFTAFLSVASGPAASASVKILSFAAQPSTAQAGAHPDFSVQFSLSTRQTDLDPCDCKDAQDITAHLPTGLIGNPHATPQCNIAQFASDHCSVDSQVGIVVASFAEIQGADPHHGSVFFAPLFNLVPPPSEPGLLGFKSGAFDTPTFEVVSARTNSDYGLDVQTPSIEHFAPLDAFRQLTWGVPADPIHDYLRFGFGQPPQLALGVLGIHYDPLCDKEGNLSTEDPNTVFQLCPINALPPRPVGVEPGGPGGPVSSESPTTPFLQNPTTCGESSLATSLEVLSYDGGTSRADSSWPATTDCAQLSFNPSQAIAPTTEAADSPSGAEFRLDVPQFESPSVPSPSELRAATVTLPAGFALAPNVRNGKTTCTGAEARFGTTEEAQCPENAKLGTISVDTPVLPGPLNGSVYLGEPQPGNRYRIFLVFDGFGVHVKLPGTVTPDPQTGQIVITFVDLPQAPFETFNMHVFGSERGPLATPTQCGKYEVSSIFTPWDASLPAITSRQFFTVDAGPNGKPCPGPARPFSPGFQAASVASSAAAHTSFAINLTRNDGDQNLVGLTVRTPPGFSATLKGVPYCSQAALTQLANPLYSGLAELASPACPASQIGTVTAGVGAGSHPLYLPGRVYLAGPYKGAPLSLEVVIPAVSGPYDLGDVAVRAALRVDPTTAQVTTVSDPFPQIVGGIPVRTRQILVNLNRPNFALNPTNCEPFSVDAQLSGDQGALASLASHFQVASCASLGFAPKLLLRFTGSTRRTGDPALTATLDNPAGSGYANLSSTQVTLPPTELIDNAHIQAPCTLKLFAQQACPPRTVIGFAKAETPLLNDPLEGPVFLRNGTHRLPDIAAALHGQIGEIDLVGHVDSVNSRLRATFDTIPDAPVSHFSLHLYGARKGLIENTEELCTHPALATVTLRAQNGKAIKRDSRLRLPCSPTHHKSKRANLSRVERTDLEGGR